MNNIYELLKINYEYFLKLINLKCFTKGCTKNPIKKTHLNKLLLKFNILLNELDKPDFLFPNNNGNKLLKEMKEKCLIIIKLQN